MEHLEILRWVVCQLFVHLMLYNITEHHCTSEIVFAYTKLSNTSVVVCLGSLIPRPDEEQEKRVGLSYSHMHLIITNLSMCLSVGGY